MGIAPFVLQNNGSLDTTTSVTDQITHNANYTQWEFHIRPGLKWSNGQNVTAQDILNTYGAQYGLNPNYDFVGLHSEIANSYAANTSTAVFVLNQSDAHLPQRMNGEIYTAVVPQEAIAQGPGADLFGTNVADGPFYSSNYTSGSPQLIMLRNPYYSPIPKACEMLVNFVESNTQITEFLVSGKTDIAGPLDPSNLPALAGYSNLHLMDDKGAAITNLIYNVTVYPYNMTQFRQALAYAINDSQISSQAFNGYALPGNSSPGTVPYTYPTYDSNTVKYSYDQNKSLSLLNSIGIKMGSDGHLQFPNGTDITLNIWAATDQTYDVTAAGIVQANLQKLGFQVNTQVTQMSNLMGDDHAGLQGVQTSMIVLSSRGPYFGDPWLDAQPGWNVFFFSLIPNTHWEYPPNIDAQYNSNVSAIDGTANVTQEQTYLNNIQALNAQYLPVIPLVYPDVVFAYNTQRWTNWAPNGYFFATNYINMTLLATATPVVSSSSSTTSTSLTGVSTTGSSISTTTTSSSPVTSSSSSSASSSSSVPLYLVAVAVLVVVVVGGIGAYVLRRKTTRSSERA
jgi:peptide/nickel transport system substrate-binding protein